MQINIPEITQNLDSAEMNIFSLIETYSGFAQIHKYD